MSKPVMLSIGGKVGEAPPINPDHPMESAAATSESAQVPEAPTNVKSASMPDESASASSELFPSQSLAQIYEVLKRHEETLRDLVVEVRLLYYNLSEKERQRLETRRQQVTFEVRNNFADNIRALEEAISRLRSNR